MEASLLLVLLYSSITLRVIATPFITTDADAYGHFMTMSDHLVVQVSNDQSQFIYKNLDILSDANDCVYPSGANEYIYGVGMGKRQNENQLHFVAIGLNISSNTQFVRIHNGTDLCPIINEKQLPTDPIRREHFVMDVDPSGQVAFGLSMGVFFIYDLINYNIRMINYSSIWNMTAWYLGSVPHWYPGFIPFAIEVISIDSALVVGYQCDQVYFNCYPNVYLITWINAQHPSIMPYLQLLPNGVIEQDYPYYVSSTVMGMAISVQEDEGIALIGVPQNDAVLLVQFNSTNIVLINTFTPEVPGIGYGQSVAWLWNNTAAIVSLTKTVSPWSSSQLAVVEFDSNNQISGPLFVLPNNQQIPGPLTTNSNIALVIFASSYFAVYFESSETVRVIAVSSPGMCPQTSSNDTISITALQSSGCIPGTYNDMITVGPCKLCPLGTRNAGSLPAASCVPCDPGSFCPRGSIADVSLSAIKNISQSLAYPESPDSTIFDDILIQSMFTIGSTPYCILVSPLFWTVVVTSVALLILTVMGILKLIPRIVKHRAVIVRIFRQTDLIGEGEMWVGGLVSFGIIVLVTFAYVFSSSYIRLYPIEDTQNVPFACDSTMRNAKFSTSLQLLATPRNDEEAPVFNLLDAQLFTLEINFVQTLFDCSSLTIQQLIGDNIVQLQPLNCSYGISIPATQTVSLALPMHQTIIKFILAGPYYIGGAYICLRGPSVVSTENDHSIQVLNFCQTFFTDNQTLAEASRINIQLTKVINRTTGLSTKDKTKYSGIWIPAFTTDSINDGLVYFQQGAYLQYLNNMTTFQIAFAETPFFIKNTQDPIARQAEVIFHDILFTIVVLEIFGLIFLIFKLTIAPLFQFFVEQIQRNKVNRLSTEEFGEKRLEDDISQDPSNSVKKPSPIIKKKLVRHGFFGLH